MNLTRSVKPKLARCPGTGPARQRVPGPWDDGQLPSWAAPAWGCLPASPTLPAIRLGEVCVLTFQRRGPAHMSGAGPGQPTCRVTRGEHRGAQLGPVLPDRGLCAHRPTPQPKPRLPTPRPRLSAASLPFHFLMLLAVRTPRRDNGNYETGAPPMPRSAELSSSGPKRGHTALRPPPRGRCLPRR